MNQIEITKGNRKVIASRSCESQPWEARVYVVLPNGYMAAGYTCGEFKSEKGLRKWADKVLAR